MLITYGALSKHAFLSLIVRVAGFSEGKCITLILQQSHNSEANVI